MSKLTNFLESVKSRLQMEEDLRVDIKLTSTLTNTFNEDSHKRSNDLTNSVTPDSNSTKRLVCGVLFTSNLDLD